MSKQTTLFQTWTSDKSSNGMAERGEVEVTEERDEFDTLFQAIPHDLPEPSNKTAVDEISGFDASAGKLWIYPINYPIRDYQFNIVQKCLYKNTMVCLPTGLGKTFIAAVVMFNFYRWYPSGKIVFLAPTKPLVAQQIEACHGITGIPQEHLAEMTGNLQPSARLELWNKKRVFFLTPQVLQNDLGRGSCPAASVCCVVFDEAHKALGNHAYCQVIKELSNARSQYRVLGLSATPGNDLKAVQQVLTNLQISQIELRCEDSFDIQQYVHSREVEKIVVPLEGPILEVKDTFLKMLSNVIGRLAKLGLLYCTDPDRLGKYQVLQARDKYRHNPPSSIMPTQARAIESDFALSISLFHAYELLLQHGLRSFYQFLSHTLCGVGGSQSHAKLEVSRSVGFTVIMSKLEGYLSGTKGEGVAPCQGDVPFFYSHPKLKKLEEVVLEHFSTLANSETRVMIFSQYRESVQEITDMLARHAPVVRVMSFVGHASAGKLNRGLTHKEQTKVVQRFRDGGYNALVSTCVGEEGLDIGDVDLIVCFDAHKSPIRLVQRMGRTGRKRSGRIVIIVAEGKEEQIYMKSQSNKSSLHRAIREGCRSLQMYPSSCAMIPRHITPQVCMMHLSVEAFAAEQVGSGGSTVRRKNSRVALHSGEGSHLKPGSNGFLSENELKDWTKLFCIPDRENASIEAAVKLVFEPTCCATLNSLAQCSAGAKEERQILNLNRWAHWQTAPIPYHIAGHSWRSVQLVSLLTFIDHIHSTDGVGLNYEMEMNAFLNLDDVEPLIQQGKSSRKRTRVLDDSSGDEGFQKQLEHNNKEPLSVESCHPGTLPSHSTITPRPATTFLMNSDHEPVLIPQAPVLIPQAPVLIPQAPVLNPQAPVLIPQAPVLIPQAPVLIPQAPVLIPQAPVLIPQAPVLNPQAPVLIPQAPVLIPQAPVLIPQAPVLIPQAPVLDSLQWLSELDASQLITPTGTPQGVSTTERVTEAHSKAQLHSAAFAPDGPLFSSPCRQFEGISSQATDMIGSSIVMTRGRFRMADSDVTVVGESDLDEEQDKDEAVVFPPLGERHSSSSSSSQEDSFLLLHGNRDQRPHNPLMTPPSLKPVKGHSTNLSESVQQLFGAEINDFLEEEAEVSGSEGQSSEEEDSGDGYEESFINDNTFLTQYPSMGPCVNRGKKTFSPGKTLSSPTGPLGSRYRMVLSQRHTILSHLMKKAGRSGAASSKKNKKNKPSSPFMDDQEVMGDDDQEVRGDDDQEVMSNDEQEVRGDDDQEVRGDDDQEVVGDDEQEVRGDDDQEVMGDDDQEVMGDDEQEVMSNDEQEVMGNDDQEVRGYASDNGSEAEEVLVGYGEEDREELTLTQESSIVEDQSPVRATQSTCEPCIAGTDEFDGDVISPSLMASIQVAPPPPSLGIGMEDWVDSDGESPLPGCDNKWSNQLDDGKQLCKPDVPFVALDPMQPKGMVLVSSREVANSQVVSILRYKYGLCVSLLSLPHGGFILSNTMLVERKLQSELSKPSNFNKFINKLPDLSELYSPVCVILEKDKIREGKLQSKSGVQFERMLARMVGMKATVLFSQSQEHTASLLNFMVAVEIQRGQGIVVPVDIIQASNPVLQLLMKIPKLSYMTALNMCAHYRTVADIVQCSSQELVEKVPAMTAGSAKVIHTFFNHRYNSGLVC